MSTDPAAPPPRVLGADGWRGGWVVAEVRRAAVPEVSWALAGDAAALLARAAGTAAAAVDCPVGLADDGPRRCDTLARARLGARASSVFAAPVRAVLGADDYAEACARSRAARGCGISLQTWHLCARIRDLDDTLGEVPDAVAECHPELAFTLMTGAPLPPKRTGEGRQARLEALRPWLADVERLLRERPRGPRPDDALDALACAWTATRLASGTALLLPPEAPRDARGRLMRIAA